MPQPGRRKQLRVVAPTTSVMLDRERRLRFDLQAFAMIEEETGINLLNGSDALDDLDVRLLSAIIWAGLTHEDPELDVDDPDERRAAIRRVRRLIDPDNISDVLRAMFAAIGQAMPEAPQDADPLSSPSSRSHGSTSGPSVAPTSDSAMPSSGS